MTLSDKDPRPQPLSREQKLAQALRANLRRRKVSDRLVGDKAGSTKSDAEG